MLQISLNILRRPISILFVKSTVVCCVKLFKLWERVARLSDKATVLWCDLLTPAGCTCYVSDGARWQGREVCCRSPASPVTTAHLPTLTSPFSVRHSQAVVVCVLPASLAHVFRCQVSAAVLSPSTAFRQQGQSVRPHTHSPSSF